MAALKLLRTQPERADWSFKFMNKMRPDEEKLKGLKKLKKTTEPVPEKEEEIFGTEVESPEVVVAQPLIPVIVKESTEFIEKVIAIKRITKVTKGGKKLSFSALVVVGDTKGRVGYYLAKAKEVSIAIRKSIAAAKKHMILVPMAGTTISHEIIGVCSGSRVLLKPAVEGTGVIAAGPVRAVCDGAGIRNILSKCHRSNNAVNVVKATFDGLTRLKSKKTTPASPVGEEIKEIQPAPAV